jgi:hypothetical protein
LLVDGSAHVLVLKLQRPWNWILVFVINNVFSNCVHFSEKKNGFSFPRNDYILRLLKKMTFENSHQIDNLPFCFINAWWYHFLSLWFYMHENFPKFLCRSGWRSIESYIWNMLFKCLTDMAKISCKSQTNLMEQTTCCLSFMSVRKGKDLGRKTPSIVLKYFS